MKRELNARDLRLLKLSVSVEPGQLILVQALRKCSLLSDSSDNWGIDPSPSRIPSSPCSLRFRTSSAESRGIKSSCRMIVPKIVPSSKKRLQSHSRRRNDLFSFKILAICIAREAVCKAGELQMQNRFRYYIALRSGIYLTVAKLSSVFVRCCLFVCTCTRAKRIFQWAS